MHFHDGLDHIMNHYWRLGEIQVISNHCQMTLKNIPRLLVKHRLAIMLYVE